ncbi:helicase associated domain-containing protein [Arthrobacter sp. NPDC093125]|uniref:helicase associated domain-containing protein n=1 Tax=Arthrobacter sp. NPDC093125 TaxID=3363944 RepID=UPI00381E9B0E
MGRMKRDRAPNQEWVMMYHGADPDLQAAQEAAAAQKTARAATSQAWSGCGSSWRWSRRRAATRPGPRKAARSAAWPHGCNGVGKTGGRAGTLAAAYRDGLAVLPGWQTPPRAETDEARWQERLKALAVYREAGNDWPRHKAAIAGQEKELGVWVHLQRSKLHRGALNSAKEQALDQAVPGWREGRQRGQTVRAAGLSSR